MLDHALIGAALRQARTQRGLSQRALAAELGLAQSMVSDLETGTVQCTIETLARLRRVLGLSADALMDIGEGRGWEKVKKKSSSL